MTSEDKRKIKVGIAISAFAIILFFGIQNFRELKGIFSFMTGVLSPFIYGICFAFILNILVNFFELKAFGFANKKNFQKWLKFRRPVSIVLSVITFLGVITGLVWFIIPQLMESTKTLAAGIQPFMDSLQKSVNGLLTQLGVSTDFNQAITGFLIEFSDTILSFVTASVPQIIKATMDITSGVFNIIFGFIVSIYMLATKEKLIANGKRLVYAYMPQKAADYTTHVYHHVNTRFGGFVAGQLTEAVILGVLCFIGMQIFNMEYALLISVIIGITNVIPIVGPFIGAVPGVFIMLMIDPMQAVWFILFIVVLQQIESNIIYPKVVGDSIGLPGLWVIFAILIGAGVFGFAGVVLGVPAFAVIYALLTESTNQRLKEKKIKL